MLDVHSLSMVVSTLPALQYLRHLRFHDYVSQLSNPVCEHVLYQRSIPSSLPALSTLDGNCRQSHCDKHYTETDYSYLPPPRRLCFRRCLSVCLLATLRKNFQTDLNEIFGEGSQWASEQTFKFCWRSGSPSGYRDCFPD